MVPLTGPIPKVLGSAASSGPRVCPWCCAASNRVPGSPFAAFDTGGADDDNAAEAAPVEKAADASADATGERANKPHETSVAESIETPVPRNKAGAFHVRN